MHYHVHPPKIIDKKGYWIKTSFDTFTDALKKELHAMKRSMRHNGIFKYDTNNPTRGWAKDHLEVFIEKV